MKKSISLILISSINGEKAIIYPNLILWMLKLSVPSLELMMMSDMFLIPSLKTKMDINLESKYLEELGKGDHKAFDMLYIQYSPRLKHFLTGFIKNRDEASDMTQDIFYKIWTNRETISKVDSFKAYLFRMARNMIYDYYEHSLIEENYQQKEQRRSTYDDLIEEELYARELSLLIDIAVEKMPPQRRNIFIMSRKDGLSNEEIAQRLNISKRTVENHMTQALAELRKIAYSTLLLFF